MKSDQVLLEFVRDVEVPFMASEAMPYQPAGSNVVTVDWRSVSVNHWGKDAFLAGDRLAGWIVDTVGNTHWAFLVASGYYFVHRDSVEVTVLGVNSILDGRVSQRGDQEEIDRRFKLAETT